MEIENNVLDITIVETKFLKKNLYDLPISNKSIPYISLYFDYQVVIYKVSSKNLNK